MTKADSKIRWPDFLYVGTSRTASTWLDQVLREHPDIRMPAPREIQYFDKNYERGPNWYGRFFEKAGAYVTGEVWHDYFLDPRAAERIHKDCPNVRIIATLREPVDRAVSRFNWSRANEKEGDVPLDQFALRAEHAHESDYLPNLKPFFARFPRDQILILFYDDLRADPVAFLRSVYEFLNVDAGFRPPSGLNLVGASNVARSQFVANLAMNTVRLLRRIGVTSLIGPLKRTKLLHSLLYRGAVPPGSIPVSDEVRANIRARYQDQYSELEAMIGRELPNGWRSDP